MIGYESKPRAVFDIGINFLIAWITIEILMSFIEYTDNSMAIDLIGLIFFFAEMLMTCNAVYRDDNLKLIVAWCTPWKNWFKTWFLVDIISWLAIIMAMQNKELKGVEDANGRPYVIYGQNSRYWRLFELLRLLKLLSVWRMKRIACSFSGNPRKPHKDVLFFLKVFSVLVFLMVIVLGVFAAINASAVNKKIASIPYTDLENLYQARKPK